MKKTAFISAIALLVLLAACDRKAFVKKIQGTWKINTYSVSGLDRTPYFDSVYNSYQLTLNSGGQGESPYTETWQTTVIYHDSTIVADTIVDTVAHTTTVVYDTLRSTHSVVTKHNGSGLWALLNSEEDLQLRDDSDATNPKLYRILKLDGSNLNLQKGNEELHLKK